MMNQACWATEYEGLIQRIPEHVARARLILGGFSTCLDKYLSLHHLEAARQEAGGTPAEDLFLELDRRAVSGVGGELFVDWPEGPLWLDRFIQAGNALGGSNSQAAQQLALLGAPALIALHERSEAQLAVIDENVLIATDHGVLPRKSVFPSDDHTRPAHYIFEYTAGKALGPHIVPRSTRTIVRFANAELEHDDVFEQVSVELAAESGGGIVCGFNGLPWQVLDPELDYAAKVARAWRARGLELVHFELGDYPGPALRDRALAEIGPIATSIGMSLSELIGLVPNVDHIQEKALRLGDTFGLSRVCIHADEWAMVLTHYDPNREREALMMGCLLASTRAAIGHPGVPRRLPDRARFIDAPFPTFDQREGWQVVCCPAPYIAVPAATIGLGDTFLAGTLLVLSADGLRLPTDLVHKNSTSTPQKQINTCKLN
jgi:ADP-dependent phosphofructokinase/glucokinase